ncbi:hypothetical protein LVJ94_12525 [Pendulispora rubella]|uniref:Uncharacterized protein n=1 Tax=Pendulispora rubella TaxID=2741070 RepID=A0ABZ2LER9_9BACT
MKRACLSGLAAAVLTSIFAASGCSEDLGVGDPCVPEIEYTATFNGFDIDQEVVESRSYQCRTRLCLVNHFQGRITCPYGQRPDGTPRSGKEACVTPVAKKPVVGGAQSGYEGAEVKAQCSARRPSDAVYCSCRCANKDGNTDDGANYCACPDGFTCEQLGAVVPGTDELLAGGYCVKSGTQYKTGSCGFECNAETRTCP